MRHKGAFFVNATFKLVAPIVAALAVAACSTGGTSNAPGVAGVPGTSLGSQARSMPDWQTRHQAKRACAEVPRNSGLAQCEVLIQNSGPMRPDVAGWAPADLQARYHLPSSTKGAGQIVAIVDAYDNPN